MKENVTIQLEVDGQRHQGGTTIEAHDNRYVSNIEIKKA